ncbi:hypothetical protein PQX77_005279 [Marasmius sp. AFHP31]|nr:hypothetical protein PQX77_005279 [Marasmius sp. AFHP31]
MARTPRNHVHVSSNSSTSRHAREWELGEIDAEREERTLLESYMVLTAQLKARLLDTQDEKNLLAQKHAREISDARDAWEQLKLRYERSKQEVRMMKKERDELKEGFEILLQKGTSSGSIFTLFEIYLSSAVAEAALPQRMSPTPEMPTIQAYAPSIISQLTTQRDDALAERDLLVRESAAKFSMLEAQLALREAELLSLQNENELNRTIRSSRSTTDNANSNSQQQTLSSDDAIRILQYNAAKNRTIQSDVKKLKRRLEVAREKPLEPGPSARSSPSPSPVPQIPPQPEPGSVVEEFAREVQELASKLDFLQLEKARLLAEIAEEKAATTEIEADKQTSNLSRSQPDPEPHCNSCERLIEENAELKAQISEVPRQQTACSSCERLREENARLQAQTHELRQLFFPSQASSPIPPPPPPSAPSQHRPISSLPRRQLSSPPPPHSQQQPSASTPPPPSPQLIPIDPPVEDDDGELSMELATPLFPSTVVGFALPICICFVESVWVVWGYGGDEDDSGIVDVVSPAAAASLLIDLDEDEDEDDETRERRRDLEGGDEDTRDLRDLTRSQFRLSELDLDRDRAPDDDSDHDNDVTARPSNFFRSPSPPSRPRTPSFENGERGDVIDEVRDILLELMPNLGK